MELCHGPIEFAIVHIQITLQYHYDPHYMFLIFFVFRVAPSLFFSGDHLPLLGLFYGLNRVYSFPVYLGPSYNCGPLRFQPPYPDPIHMKVGQPKFYLKRFLYLRCNAYLNAFYIYRNMLIHIGPRGTFSAIEYCFSCQYKLK